MASLVTLYKRVSFHLTNFKETRKICLHLNIASSFNLSIVDLGPDPLLEVAESAIRVNRVIDLVIIWIFLVISIIQMKRSAGITI